MLRVTISDEGWDPVLEEFTAIDPVVIEMEHSLISLSKWESKFEKPFLAKGNKEPEEIFEYIKMMTITEDLPPGIFDRISKENVIEINEYIDSKQSATTFVEMSMNRGTGETITSELIYYWMVAFAIPLQCEEWHLNRLFALIRICSLKNGKQKSMPKQQVSQQYRELNEKRKRELGTRG
jgi:hypothetical protein